MYELQEQAEDGRRVALPNSSRYHACKQWWHGGNSKGCALALPMVALTFLHSGHVSLLADARTQCDRLVVALNSDSSVRRLKGPSTIR